MKQANTTSEETTLFTILADYSDDLHSIKMRDGKLPADAAVARIQAWRDAAVVDAAHKAQSRLCEALKRAVHEYPEWPMDDIVALLYKETGDLIDAEAKSL